MIVYLPLQNGTEHPEELIYLCGKTSYGSHYESADITTIRNFIKARIKEGHESILEHCSITFKILGISRACSHQLVRHRLASYTQESQRYTKIEFLETVCPDSIAENIEASRMWDECIRVSHDTYLKLISLGIPREDARYVLPNAARTNIAVTMNYRELRHFFSMRCDEHAQWEIRELANKMLKLAYEIAPSVFQDLIERYVIE